MLKLLVIGATSAIAHETIKHFAADGATLFLAGRSEDKLNIVRDDLLARGAAGVETFVIDMNDLDRHQALFDAALDYLGTLDALYMAHGTLGDQDESEASVEAMQRELTTNFISAAAFLTLAANHFEAQRRGSIAVISSVAGDRGRASNYVYGTAMAAKTAFLGGLRNRLAKAGVHVLTIKPGPVATPMTAHMKASPLLADPGPVGETIYKAMKNERDILYVPGYWMLIMMIIRNIPERIFKRLNM